ncbi:HNH endonuclease [Cohaesibacter marisflavi]|uniref:HNH endonuclease n=1 Tax=Cohaesibacter marisflavi TaxID=655353 RepID=UPI0029C7997A|nr:HNH endonuclease [Cohaesibacter marisflavi]
MKLMNLRRFDSDYKGKGLQRGGKDEQVVWDTYFSRRDELKRTADAIKAMLKADLRPSELTPSPDLEEAPEGQLLTRMHSFRERNREIVKNKKAQALERDGQLKCEVCGFNFEEVYGETGESFIEYHHTKPVSEMSPTDQTKLADLALVCSNCHRMIHHQRPWLTIDELKSKLKR